MNKYKITAADTIMPMQITFRDIETGNLETISVGINYVRDQVVFNSPLPEGTDAEELGQEILANLRPPTIDMPKLPSDVFERVAKVRAGEYKSFVPEANHP